MQAGGRAIKVLGAFALGSTLLLGGLRAAEPEAGGSGVTLANDSDHDLKVYTRFGGDGSCSRLPNERNVTISPKQSATIESGSSKVCVCLQTPEHRTCPSTWIEVAAGGSRHFV